MGKPAAKHWGSDVIVDLIQAYDLPYAAINPGSSFRGLHDSLVNYGEGRPAMLLCPHEEIAVQIAHGYAKASGKPMLAIVHDVVGLLHATMAVYYAYIDRAPVLLIGATGPLDEADRRPMIDWIHTANVQGEAVRAFTKWDYQPASPDGIVDSFARAYGIMMTEPYGPVYLCYDAGLQERPLAEKPALTATVGARAPTAVSADATALGQAADLLVAAEHPLLLAEYGGARAFAAHVALAETLGAGFIDVGSRLNFPSRHPLNLSLIDEALAEADIIAGLDVRDWERVTSRLDRTTRQTTSLVGKNCRWIDIGFGDLEISAWSMDYQRFRRAELRILGDTATAVPALDALCRERIAGQPALQKRIAARSRRLSELHATAQRRWAERARARWDDAPISLPRLASELWMQIEHEDWVLTSNTLRDWTRRLWNFDAPHRHPGKSLGTATQIGISLGVALAHKGTERLVVAIEPDGDLMFDPAALWVAAKYDIPLLIVMFNNRAYYNDWEHQILMARLRGTPEDRAHIGMDLFGPDPDFAGLARSMGCVGIGPVVRPDDIATALAEGIAQVKTGKPAVVDVVTAHR